MAGRRRIGVGAVQQRAEMQARYQSKGDEMAHDQLERLASQLGSFTRRLEEFAAKHRDEIRKNPQFRRHFQEMCTTVGVDPLASSKGFWSKTLGVGDFYYELAVQIVEVCLATSHLNGGLITLDDLRARLLRSRSKTRKEAISRFASGAASGDERATFSDDIMRAVSKLKVLGHGFELIPISGAGSGGTSARYMIQSVPGELSMDETRILQLAEEHEGRVSVALCVDSLRWEPERAARNLDRLVRLERAWIDEAAAGGAEFWFSSLFLDSQRPRAA